MGAIKKAFDYCALIQWRLNNSGQRAKRKHAGKSNKRFRNEILLKSRSLDYIIKLKHPIMMIAIKWFFDEEKLFIKIGCWLHARAEKCYTQCLRVFYRRKTNFYSGRRVLEGKKTLSEARVSERQRDLPLLLRWAPLKRVHHWREYTTEEYTA